MSKTTYCEGEFHTLLCTVQRYLRGLQSHCILPLVRQVPGVEAQPPSASEDHLRNKLYLI